MHVMTYSLVRDFLVRLTFGVSFFLAFALFALWSTWYLWQHRELF